MIESIVACDAVRIPAKLGIAKVDKEGGLRSMGNARLGPRDVGLVSPSRGVGTLPRADSNNDLRASVRSDCGTIEEVINIRGTAMNQHVRSRRYALNMEATA